MAHDPALVGDQVHGVRPPGYSDGEESDMSLQSPSTPAQGAGQDDGVEPLDILLLVKRPSDPTLNHLQVLKDVQVAHRGYDISTPSTRKGAPSESSSALGTIGHQPAEHPLEAERAATAIQSAYRGYAVRKELKVNAAQRAPSTPTRHADKDEERAAVAIQSAYRGHAVRKNAARPSRVPPQTEEVRAACTLQRAVRAHAARRARDALRALRDDEKHGEDAEAAARMIQKAYRAIARRAFRQTALEAMRLLRAGALSATSPRRSSLAILSDSMAGGATHLMRLVDIDNVAGGDAPSTPVRAPRPPAHSPAGTRSPAARRVVADDAASTSAAPVSPPAGPSRWVDALGYLSDTLCTRGLIENVPSLHALCADVFGFPTTPVAAAAAPRPSSATSSTGHKHNTSLSLLCSSVPQAQATKLQLMAGLLSPAAAAAGSPVAAATLSPVAAPSGAPEAAAPLLPAEPAEPERAYLSYLKPKRAYRNVHLMVPADGRMPPPQPAHNYGSFLPSAAVPVGKRPSCLLLHVLGADQDGWDLEQVDETVVLAAAGPHLDLASAAIDDPTFARIHNRPCVDIATPAVADLFAADGAFHTSRDELVRQRDSCVVYSYYKGPCLTALFESLSQPRYHAWAEAHRDVALQHVTSKHAASKIHRELHENIAKTRGRVEGLREKCAVQMKQNKGGTPEGLEQARAELDRSEQELELLNMMEYSVREIGPPEGVLEVIHGEDDFMRKMTLNEVAEGTCLAIDATFLVDEQNTLRRSATVHTVFAPMVPTTTPSPALLRGVYTLALAAVEARGFNVASISPLLPQAVGMPLASPPHIVMMHLGVIADLLAERTHGLTQVYISTLGLPVDVARRAFEKRGFENLEIHVHSQPAKAIALALRRATSLVVPTRPLAILGGTPGRAWATARGHGYKQEEEALAESTAVLAHVDFNTVYTESLRHRLVDKPAARSSAAPAASPYRGRGGRVIESRLPPGARAASNNAAGRREARVLSKVRDAQERDAQLQQQQQQLEAGAAEAARKLKDRVLDEVEQRRAFAERMEQRNANAVPPAELEKMYRERDQRIQERKARKEKELQQQMDAQRAEAEAAEFQRRERNRIHREQEEARRKRQAERQQRLELEREGQRVLELGRKAEEEKKRAQKAKNLLAAQQEREERRRKLREEVLEKRRQEEAAKERAAHEEMEQKMKEHEAIRRKLAGRAESERRKRQDQPATATDGATPGAASSAATQDEESRKFAELKQLKRQNNGPPQRKNLPAVLPKLDRNAAAPRPAAQARRASRTKLAPLAVGVDEAAAVDKKPPQRRRSRSRSVDAAARAAPQPQPTAAAPALHVGPRGHYTMENIEELAKPFAVAHV